jgi:purine-nucleoside phosphorylase
MSTLPERIETAAAAMHERHPEGFTPRALVILGSGLGGLADETPTVASVPYGEIPGFVASTAPGHAGRLVFGHSGPTPVALMQGRLHFYEGYSLEDVTFPVRVAKALGADTLVVTNAAGGLNPSFRVGDLMLIADHINLMGFGGQNPLRGPHDVMLGVRFLPMNPCYDQSLLDLARQVAHEQHLEVRKGIYVMIPGPTFETNAELHFLRMAGGDAVGMSTIPEVIVARHGGMRALGISCITNMAVPDWEEPVDHESVLAVAAAARPRFTALVQGVLTALDTWTGDVEDSLHVP